MEVAHLTALARAGRILEALRHCQAREGVATVERRVICTELLHLAGELDRAVQSATALERLTSGLTPAQRARVSFVRACVALEQGDAETGFDLLQRTAVLAEEAKDPATCAITAAHILERLPGGDLQETASLASQTKRYAIRAGDPHVSARVHITFARVEGRIGNFDTASRHLAVADSLLQTEHNEWISTALDIDHGVILALVGDYDAAIDMTLRAASRAISCGWTRGQAISALNLGFLYVTLGKEHQALEWIKRAPAAFTSQRGYRLAVAETLAQAEFSKGNFAGAEELLEKFEVAGQHKNIKWYELSCHVTRSRIALARSDWIEAQNRTEAGLRLASKLRNPKATIELTLCRAEALAGGGSELSRTDLESLSTRPLSPELLGNAHLVLGRALQNEGHSEAGFAYVSRGVRLLNNVGSAQARLRAQLASPEGEPPARDGAATLEDAVALLELAGYPHILGPEAFALLRATGCAERAALVAAGTAKTRIVDVLGWTEAQARAALDDDTVERLPLGARGHEIWTLLVRPCADLDRFCAYAAIRRLLAFAASLDQHRRHEQQRTALWPADALEADPDCIWVAEPMVETLSVARRIATSPLSVLITGETGTGKEMLARAIHRASDRAERTFLPFNCTAVPRDMLESQLFGFRKGAFTGADTAFPGVIRAAAGGTLFLDEIAEVGPDVQPKLLRFLESHEIHPLGEPHPIKVDVRIIAATNAGIEHLVAEGRFREDLFYRLNVVRLRLPPLRERREEIPPLVQHYLRRYGDELRKGYLTVSDETLEYLLLFSWPGNVRQLANEVRRMVALAEPAATITPALLSPEILASRRTIPAAPERDAATRVALDQPLPAAVEQLEQLMVRRALDQTRGRVDDAARLLGISRKGLFLKRRRWGLGSSSS